MLATAILPLLQCVHASRAAYLGGQAAVDELSCAGLELLDDLSDASYRILVAGDADSLTVAFRGTDDIHDALEDARVMPVPFRALDLVGAPLVHRGFRDVWLGAVQRVWQAVATHRLPGRPVRLTGHSLGGGLATVAAVDCGIEPLEVITFGSPRVGLGEFVSQYTKLGITTTRVVHHRDIVPTVPGLPYAHVCQPLRLDDAGNVIGRLRGWLSELLGTGRQVLDDIDGAALAQHHVDTYVLAVQAYASRLFTHAILTGVPA